MSSSEAYIGDISKAFGSITNNSDVAVTLVIKMPITDMILTVDIQPGETKQAPFNAFASVYRQGQYSKEKLVELHSSSVAGIPIGMREKWEVYQKGDKFLLKKV